jgi:hypothetical protein
MSELRNALVEQIAEHTPGSVAPFAGVRRRARTRRRNEIVAGALAAVLAVAGGGVLAIRVLEDRQRPAPVTGLPTDGPPPQRVTFNGHQLRLAGETEVVLASIDREDRSVLVVQAGYAAAEEGTDCVPHTTVRVLAQDARTVRIGAYTYVPIESPPANSACPAVGYPAKEHRLQLGAPLDGRRVLDGSTELVVYDPATVLTPTYLPSGYSQPGRLSFGGPWGIGRPLVGGAELSYSVGGDDFMYIREADPTAEAAYNNLGGQASLFGPESAFDIEARPTVRGQQGLVFAYGAGLRCLRWRESSSLAVVICSHGIPSAPLAAEELLKVAESLRLPR